MLLSPTLSRSFFFFNDPATPEIYPLSLPYALPISLPEVGGGPAGGLVEVAAPVQELGAVGAREVEVLELGPDVERVPRSEEHTSELQSQSNLVCRLLLEKKKEAHIASASAVIVVST